MAQDGVFSSLELSIIPIVIWHVKPALDLNLVSAAIGWTLAVILNLILFQLLKLLQQLFRLSNDIKELLFRH